MTIILTPIPDQAAIRVQIAVTSGSTLTSLVRLDDNGARPVRLMAGQGLAAGQLVLTDYEPALTGRVLYRLVTQRSGQTLNEEASTSLDGARACLAAAVYPMERYYPGERHVSDSLTYARESASVIHPVIDRPDPLVTIGTLRTRRGSLRILCDTYGDARAIEDVYNAGHVMLWRQTEFAGLDLYHVADPEGLTVELDPARTTPRRWIVNVPWVEVAAPTGPILGALSWTVDALAAAVPTIAAVRTLYPSVTALAIGPTS